MTNFYDCNIPANEKILITLEQLGFTGGIIFTETDKFESEQQKVEDLKSICDLELYHGARIKTTNPNHIHKLSQKYLNISDVISVYGGDPTINRIALETPQVKILEHPYNNKQNSGMNHILARKACDNNTTISIDYMDILRNKGYYKAKLLNQIIQLVLIKEKYHFNLMINSGTKSIYDLRTPRAIKILGNLFNMTTSEVNKSISNIPSKVIVDIHNKESFIVNGVRKIE
ncbi:MAG: RNase P subunit p30 family protein [Methanobacteriaceae archaeon]|nr:RNase P subunit p30 family protein [Methanobacteriaceae archaeon]